MLLDVKYYNYYYYKIILLLVASLCECPLG